LVCENDAPIQAQLTATPDFSIYTTHVYQWQESTDTVVWTDIPGATDQNYTTPALASTRYYRVKVAEDAINLANPLCSSLSDVFVVQVVPQPVAPISNGDVFNCGDESEPISVTVPNEVIVNWYDAPYG